MAKLYVVPYTVYATFKAQIDALPGQVEVIGEGIGIEANALPLDAEIIAISGVTTAGAPIVDDHWTREMQEGFARRVEAAGYADEASAFLMKNPQGVCGFPSRPTATLGSNATRILACTQAAGHLEAQGIESSGLHTAVHNNITYGWLDEDDHPMPITDREEILDLPPLDTLPLWDLRPRDVPRLRAGIVDWISGEWGQAWARATIEYDQWMLPGPLMGKPFDWKVSYVCNMIGRCTLSQAQLADGLRTAGSYYVSADMCALAVEAAQDLDPDWVYLPDDPPEPDGFLVTEMPIPWATPRSGTNTATDFRYRYYGVSWHRLESGAGDMFVQFWTRKADSLEAFRLDGPERAQPSVQEVSGADFVITEEMYAQTIAPMTPDNEAVLIAGGRWKYRHLDPHLQWVVAIWRLMKQPNLVTVNPNAVDRAGRRQAVRLKQEPAVSLVHLRTVIRDHSKPLDGEHKPIEWTCRWRVRSFWRRPARTSPDHPKTIYVPSYVKGPGDKPFRPRVTIVDR